MFLTSPGTCVSLMKNFTVIDSTNARTAMLPSNSATSCLNIVRHDMDPKDFHVTYVTSILERSRPSTTINLFILERHRNNPFHLFKIFSPFQLFSLFRFYCQACDIKFRRKHHLKIHVQTVTHANRIMELKNRGIKVWFSSKKSQFLIWNILSIILHILGTPWNWRSRWKLCSKRDFCLWNLSRAQTISLPLPLAKA